MEYDPEIHQRRSIRLCGYDYSRSGLYAVTICTHGKQHLFGEIVEGQMNSTEYGETVKHYWNELPRYYPHARLDAFVMVPNHVHGIIEILPGDAGAGLQTCPAPGGRRHPLSEIVRGFKTYSARRINDLRGTPGRLVWQRNYYEHIVRNDDELNKIREYIATNPLRWGGDCYNPEREILEHSDSGRLVSWM